MALPRGTWLCRERYQIQKLLARGGFGFIYLARDRLLGRQIVLKELIPALISDTDALRRFIREAKTLQRLQHPNIVQTEAMFKERGHYYLVMEYLNGGTLAEWIERSGKLELSEAVVIVAALCNALSYLHQVGITHCDLQPGNILFDVHGHPKLIDLGIAHVSDTLVHRPWRTERNIAIGTIFYMSPEQLDGIRNDPRIDLYALGALFYQMLSGHPYLDFDLRNTPGARADNVNRVRSQMPRPISGIPDPVNKVMLRALAKQPDERYLSVEAFRKELAQVTLPYLSPAKGIHLTLAFSLADPSLPTWKPSTDEWPQWVWAVLIVANLGMMLWVALLILTVS